MKIFAIVMLTVSAFLFNINKSTACGHRHCRHHHKPARVMVVKPNPVAATVVVVKPRKVWVDGHWRATPRGMVWVPGHWARR